MFFSHSFRRSDFTYGVTKDQNVEMFFDKGDFWRSDFTYGVTKDQNVESLFSEFFLVFDVLIFVVLTISPKNHAPQYNKFIKILEYFSLIILSKDTHFLVYEYFLYLYKFFVLTQYTLLQ
jgi:hypothetical protein